MSFLHYETLTVLAEMITSKFDVYRSGSEIESFFASCQLDFKLSSGSRYPATKGFLIQTNNRSDAPEKLSKVLENVIDPRVFIKAKENHLEAVKYLNQFLEFDGYKLQFDGKRHKLVKNEPNGVILLTLNEKVDQLNLDSVKREAERANKQAEDDPEDAITAACCMVESVCKSLLEKINRPLPKNKDIAHLMKEIQKQLNLLPNREDFPEDFEPDIKQVLGGLSNVANGIGSLRTHAGDAHGKGQWAPKVDSRIARLTINSAATISLFLIETWQRLEMLNRT